ncbi:DNA repair protein Mre11 [Populus alba x Populus x berolinensis]|nr:DNA repair protein Mre11 [Populus alba x Populus x berolinensis]
MSLCNVFLFSATIKRVLPCFLALSFVGRTGDLSRDDVANTLRILVATDCHLGDMEKDEIRRHDSFQAFEETYSIAEQKKG